MFILASKSPRRIELLEAEGYQFKIVGSEVEEVLDKNVKPSINAINVAFAKAEDVAKKYPGEYIIAADTIVVFKNEILGKPKSEEDAFNMLKKLSKNKHEVITGVVILKDNYLKKFYVKTQVFFNDLSDEEISNYVATKEPFGKAGSYAIQGLAKPFIKKYRGDFHNVMGLPMKKLSKVLKKIL